MSIAAGFNRAGHSAALRFVAGSAYYGAFLNDNGVVLTNAAAFFIILGMNMAGRTRVYEMALLAIINCTSGVFATIDVIDKITSLGWSAENRGKAFMAGAYFCWTFTDIFRARLEHKNIETADKKHLDPANPTAVGDVLAVGFFPPLMVTSALAVYRQAHQTPVHEDAPVATEGEFYRKHSNGNRWLALGMLMAGAAGAFTGLGVFYAAAFALWTAGYLAFDPKRNAALIPDWRQVRALKAA